MKLHEVNNDQDLAAMIEQSFNRCSILHKTRKPELPSRVLRRKKAARRIAKSFRRTSR